MPVRQISDTSLISEIWILESQNMGKRNKKKIRKIMRAQAEHQTSPISEETNVAQLEAAKTVSQPQPDKKNEADIAETHEVKKEIRKILITYAILILTIVAIYLVNAKTDIILKAGQWIVSQLHLSI